ncbi:hypothetical protein EOD10_09210 [Mesorhizobium sp. M7A.T.Ca.TU.009.01.3.2]|jgi:hypothetical protein|nr:hypothetical protein [Mesorhizobium sp. M7A.F.Ca.CA.002.04.1.1]PBB23170.1 hypothetical protein CK232_29335 [Mesorhizobium sp. WSM4304]RUU17955.1 hypothetical protein EOD10_09210 [Mesorhizobium sp. M7A.T.Ca.TU.009.01.3.2]RUV12110.1 hypothetical protein EOD00_07915 [Mesorhizobium sp. M7A.T.Ca.TU.009.01.3.1]RUX61195.1 hypothetical protein EN994_03040 [Mesorhizobium sp. M7A.F.Ca.CA.002.09.1.1]RVA36019.1 hypothetical protein EN935_02985 [Mesorhizobium sp. M7D.F.Ca.US.004.03.1.1]TIM22603.1 MAG: 
MEAEAYAKAVDCLTKDQNASLALYDFRRQRAQLLPGIRVYWRRDTRCAQIATRPSPAMSFGN